MEQVLLEWDTDGSGTLDQKEFSDNMRNELGFKASNEELEQLYRMADDDESGEQSPPCSWTVHVPQLKCKLPFQATVTILLLCLPCVQHPMIRSHTGVSLCLRR